MFTTAAVVLLLFFQAPANPGQQPAKSTIEGEVFKSASGEPLDRARLTLTRLLPPQTGPSNTPITPPPQIPPVQTERDGKFVFKDLDPGQYRLRVVRNGYAGQEYGQRTATTAGTVINLTEGQQLKDVTFRLIPAATITGRVRDSTGESVPGVQVTLLRSTYNVSGQRSLSGVGGATTDDRGEYRIFWVPGGRYVLSVGGSSGFVVFSTVDGGQSSQDRLVVCIRRPGLSDDLLSGNTRSITCFRY